MMKLLLTFTLILSLLTAGSFAFAQGGSEADANNGITAGGITADRFADIAKHWAKDSINRVADREQFAADKGKFLPDKAITRSEFALMLHKALGIEIMYVKAPDIGEFFSDVSNDAVFAAALYDLASVGIIDWKDTFKPESALTRQEMVHILMNAYRYKMGDSFAQIKLSVIAFADQSSIDPAFSGDIARAEHDGLIKRPANQRFYPVDLATRAQAATVTDRLLRLLEKEDSKVLVTPAAILKNGVLKMSLTVTNLTDSRVVIKHSSGQKFDFELLDSGRESLYRWSADKLFIMALTETVIEPGKSVEFTSDAEKALLDSFKGKPMFLKAFITGSSDSFKVNEGGYETTVVEIK